LTAKAFSPWGFRSTHGVVVAMPVDEAREAGEQAAGMAKRLGRVDLESGALDALASSYIVDTDVLAQQAVIDRRLELAGQLQDPKELGDIYAMAAWVRYDTGSYRQALEFAE